MTQLVPSSALQINGNVQLPALIAEASDQAQRRFVEFFAAHIRNKNTRQAYARAVRQFLAWCDARGIALQDIEPIVVAAYIEQHPGSVATVKQHLAAIKHLFDWLVTGQVLPHNPATSVRGPSLVQDTGTTPILEPEQARALLDSPNTDTLWGLRDRALIAVMLFTFARVSAVVRMQVGDYVLTGKQANIRLMEKGGKVRTLPLHHLAEEYLDEWLEAAGIVDDKKTPLFRKFSPSRELTEESLSRHAAYQMIRHQAKAAGLAGVPIGCHSMRGTGITTYLQNAGALETAQQIAGHASARTTKLYDRRDQQVQQAEVERIRF